MCDRDRDLHHARRDAIRDAELLAEILLESLEE